MTETTILAETDPGVELGWNLPGGLKTFLVETVGSFLTLGLIVAVGVLALGLIVWGVGGMSNRPGIAGFGVKVVAITGCVAAGCAGANGIISWFAGQGTTIFL